MAVLISNLAVAQGTGVEVKESVLEVRFDLALDGANAGQAAQIYLEFREAAAATWKGCVLHNATGSTVRAAGIGLLFLVRLHASLGDVTPALFAGFEVRVKATEGSDDSGWSSQTLQVEARRPSVSDASLPPYVNQSDAQNPVSMTVTAVSGEGGEPAYYRYAFTSSAVQPGATTGFLNWPTGAGQATTGVDFTAVSDGERSVYLKVYDAYYNESTLFVETTWVQKTLPQNLRLSIFGTQRHRGYTGIWIDPDDGHFEVDRKATLQVGAESPLPLEYKILTHYVEAGPTETDVDFAAIDTWIPLTPENATPIVKLAANPNSPESSDYNTDATVEPRVQFRDAAGNVTAPVATAIRLNTRIYQTAHRPLVEPSAEYGHQLVEVLTDQDRMIPTSQVLEGDPIRAWQDVFYPPEHSFPVDANGTFDEAAAIAMGGVATTEHDPVKLYTETLSNGQTVTRVQVDEENRPLMASWSDNKQYGHMLSSDSTSLTAWILDNTGWGQFQLEFDRFDFNRNGFGPPHNPESPYPGDVLVVYDATADGALRQELGEDGLPKWVIHNTAALREIAAYTGSGSNVVNLTTGLATGSNPDGGFKSEWFRGIDRVVLILYTDAAGAGTGFRLMAGVEHPRVWVNYDVDEARGELWVHKHQDLTDSGKAGSDEGTAKRFVYDYYDAHVDFDVEAGEVIFTAPPSGVVSADYSYYEGGDYQTHTFLASEDDFVFYQDALAYVAPSGVGGYSQAITGGVYQPDAEGNYDPAGSGLMTLDHDWEKDKGYLEIASAAAVPHGRRIFANYSHHTFQRLGNDGYSDLLFRDSVVVADRTPRYPDYTWRDIKIVNEGDADLEDPQIKFVARGYDTDSNEAIGIIGAGGVDQVFDVQRPWDVQRGTKDETYEKMACKVMQNYQFPPFQSKERDDQGNDGATDILGDWQDEVWPFDLPARQHVYGRVVLVLGGTSGNSYPETTAGDKRCSLEFGGRYYTDLVF